MSVDDVAIFEGDGIAVDVSEGDVVAALALEDLGAGVRFGSVLDDFGEECAVSVVDHDWLGDVHGHLQGHAELPDGEGGIARDDRAGAEVDALAHEVASDAPELGVEAVEHALEDAAAALLHGSTSPQLVVAEHGDEVLEHVREPLYGARVHVVF